MTAASRPALSSVVSQNPSGFAHGQDGDTMRKNLSQNAARAKIAAPRALARQWFAGLLWQAFPANSEREVARRAAPVLDVSERQVVNWLRCENDAGVSYVAAVMILAGAVKALDPIRGRAA